MQRWIPQVIKAHPYITGVVTGITVMSIGYRIWKLAFPAAPAEPVVNELNYSENLYQFEIEAAQIANKLQQQYEEICEAYFDKKSNQVKQLEQECKDKKVKHQQLKKADIEKQIQTKIQQAHDKVKQDLNMLSDDFQQKYNQSSHALSQLSVQQDALNQKHDLLHRDQHALTQEQNSLRQDQHELNQEQVILRQGYDKLAQAQVELHNQHQSIKESVAETSKKIAELKKQDLPALQQPEKPATVLPLCKVALTPVPVIRSPIKKDDLYESSDDDFPSVDEQCSHERMKRRKAIQGSDSSSDEEVIFDEHSFESRSYKKGAQ